MVSGSEYLAVGGQGEPLSRIGLLYDDYRWWYVYADGGPNNKRVTAESLGPFHTPRVFEVLGFSKSLVRDHPEGLAFPWITGYGRTVVETDHEGGTQVFFLSGLETQVEINRLLDRLFGSYD